MSQSKTQRLPAHGWLGLLLAGVGWAANWGLDGLRTHLWFFPMWLGYVLLVDGLCVARTRTSLLTRSRLGLVQLFLVSMPLWWIFELINLRTANWVYVGREHFSDLEYFLLASLAFSTVLPAVLSSAELVLSFGWIERFARGPRIAPTVRLRRGCWLLGGAMLASLLLFPRTCFPFAWTSLVLLVEALNQTLGRRSLVTDLARGDWRPWIALWTGGLVCGFFWELWNHGSYPYWIYQIPFVGFGKVFEMPILGYLGYLPFAHELWLFTLLLLPGATWLQPPQETSTTWTT